LKENRREKRAHGMSRYIDEDTLVKRLKHSPLFLGTNMQFKEGVIDLVKRQPTADVVDVVRCRDCKKAKKTLSGYYTCPYTLGFYHYSDDYCSYGERSENEKS
jgi:hypothetical protein